MYKLLYGSGKTAPALEKGAQVTVREVDVGEIVILEEVESESGDVIAKMVCERLRSIDFTIGEYPIDIEVYTEEMDKEYKKFLTGFIKSDTDTVYVW